MISTRMMRDGAGDIVHRPENIVYFWEKPFGDNPQNPPSLEGKPMKFDLGNLQTQVERFYRFFRDTLKFSAG